MGESRNIGFEVRILSNALKRKINQKEQNDRSGLTGMQKWIIDFVANQPDDREIYQRDIEKEFDIRRSTVTSLLQLMERNGWIYRISVASDARLKMIVLSDKAKQYHRERQEDFQRTEAQLKKGLSPQQLEVFFEVIDRINKNMEEM